MPRLLQLVLSLPLTDPHSPNHKTSRHPRHPDTRRTSSTAPTTPIPHPITTQPPRPHTTPSSPPPNVPTNTTPPTPTPPPAHNTPNRPPRRLDPYRNPLTPPPPPPPLAPCCHREQVAFGGGKSESPWASQSTVFIPSAVYNIEEDIGELFVPVRRSGDVSQELMVVCYTHQVTATGTVPTTVLSYSDYISRAEDHHSLLRFDRGEEEKACRVLIIDDSLYEDEESFNVSLSTPMGGGVGRRYSSTRVNIVPDMDDGKTRFIHLFMNCTNVLRKSPVSAE
uniref:Calx-beta domain-containing protein n=1 Tax=Knipowitschia caucasica TaxID=637954 RepID=A0AAV2JAC2_KNICA